MNKSAVLILDHQSVKHKIKRIAYQIYESNVDEKELFLAGIAENGFQLAEKLEKELQEISSLRIRVGKLHIDKKHPLNKIKANFTLEEVKDKSVVLVDDVLNSGTTLIYGVRYFLKVPLKQFITVVLVDRNHKKYPVKADFKGISLSTSLNERVEVTFKEGNDKVELL